MTTPDKPIQFPLFDTSRLDIAPLSGRDHDLDLSVIKPLVPQDRVHKDLKNVAGRVIKARGDNAAVLLMMGAHVIRAGVQPYLIDMLEKGHISCLSMAGAGIIHDFEFALIGQTTENVARYIADGRFGLWRETGRINDIVRQAAQENIGLGEAIGREIHNGDFPHKGISLFAAAYRLGIPVTVHVGIGYDIVHEHPNCDGGSWGQTSYTDFLRFAGVLESLKDGVIMNFGSAVMAPEVFLKALAMVRNAAARENRSIDNFTTLVCDLRSLPDNYRCEAPKNTPEYFFRPWKTMLVRSMASSGKSYYVQAPHEQTIPELWTALQVTG